MPYSYTGKRKIFPLKLYELLESAEGKGYDHIVSWVGGSDNVNCGVPSRVRGQSWLGGFKIHNIKEFATTILPKQFGNNKMKYKSFLRQLSLYGFKRIITTIQVGGNELPKGTYVHKHMIKGQPRLCELIKRASTLPSSAATAAVCNSAAGRRASNEFRNVRSTPALPIATATTNTSISSSKLESNNCQSCVGDKIPFSLRDELEPTPIVLFGKTDSLQMQRNLIGPLPIKSTSIDLRMDDETVKDVIELFSTHQSIPV